MICLKQRLYVPLRGGGQPKSLRNEGYRAFKKTLLSYCSKIMQIKSQQNNYKRAFTLAEVLITLGIIGIVAAMVLPTLMNNVQDKVLETQRKKAGSVLANGYKKMMADNEVFNIWDTPLLMCMESSDSLSCIDREHKKVYKTIYSGQLGNNVDLTLPDKYTDTEGNELTSPWTDALYVFVTPDGFVYGMDVEKIIDDRTFNVYADVNGKKNPNTANKDLVLYTVTSNGSVVEAPIEANNCSYDNFSGCSEAQCNALGSRQISDDVWECFYWDDVRCRMGCPS